MCCSYTLRFDLSTFILFSGLDFMSRSAGFLSETGMAYPQQTPVFTLGFYGEVCVAHLLSFLCVFVQCCLCQDCPFVIAPSVFIIDKENLNIKIQTDQDSQINSTKNIQRKDIHKLLYMVSIDSCMAVSVVFNSNVFSYQSHFNIVPI